MKASTLYFTPTMLLFTEKRLAKGRLGTPHSNIGTSKHGNGRVWRGVLPLASFHGPIAFLSSRDTTYCHGMNIYLVTFVCIDTLRFLARVRRTHKKKDFSLPLLIRDWVASMYLYCIVIIFILVKDNFCFSLIFVVT